MKFKLFGLVAAAVFSSVAYAAPASAASYALIDCTNTNISGAKICFYYNTANNNDGQGKFINGSNYDIKNQGGFSKGDTVYVCGNITTKAHTTSTCTRSLGQGSWSLVDDYYGLSGKRNAIKTDPHDFAG